MSMPTEYGHPTAEGNPATDGWEHHGLMLYVKGGVPSFQGQTENALRIHDRPITVSRGDLG